MTEHTTLYLRAHTDPPARFRFRKKKNQNRPDESNEASAPADDEPQDDEAPKWPDYALIVDTETSTDEKLSLLFGFYRLCHLEPNGNYVCVEENILHADGLPESDIETIREFCARHKSEVMPGCPEKIKPISRAQFVAKLKCVAYDPRDGFGALVCGFNLPFDLSRLCVDEREAHSRKEEWSLVLSQKSDPETGELKDDLFCPRISLTPKDSKSAFIRFTSGSFDGVDKKTGKPKIHEAKRGRWLDLRTLLWSLFNIPYSLKSACDNENGPFKGQNLPQKDGHEATGTISETELSHCRNDVRCTTALLNATKAEFDRHLIDSLKPDRSFSTASVAKAHLKEIGITNPCEKKPPKDSTGGISIGGFRTQGKAMQAYFGGRAETRIRNTPLPIVYTDFLSEYCTVNTLLGSWDLITAETIEIVDFTSEARRLVSGISTEGVFHQEFWKELLFFAEVLPQEDIFPVRAKYNRRSTNIGMNFLTSEKPRWYAGPDVVASKILTGKAPQIKKAFKIVATGKQPDLKKILLRGQVEIDPYRDDLFKSVVQLRTQVKKDNPDLGNFLKTFGNSGAYGIWIECNQEKAINGSEKVSVFSGSEEFDSNPSIIESHGAFYCPVIGALIPSAGRLMLALLERLISDAGGFYMFCDTDSASIISSKEGGYFPCIGGPHRLTDGREAVYALPWAKVKSEIVDRFDSLNPYGDCVRNSGRGTILKLEDVNFDNDGKGDQREVWGYSVSAKRYALFTRSGNSFQIASLKDEEDLNDGIPSEDTEDQLDIAAAKMHGLGFLYPPDDRKPEKEGGLRPWIREAWVWIVRGALGMPRTDPAWFSAPAIMQLRITSHNVLKVLQEKQKLVPYSERVKPLNFVLSPIIDQMFGIPAGCDPDKFSLIAPFTKNREAWWKLKYTNIHDGSKWSLRKFDSYELKGVCACPKTFGEYIAEYAQHEESKSLAPDGGPCKKRTTGLLKRAHVHASGRPVIIGKETSRKLIHDDDVRRLTESEHLEYTPSGPQRDPRLRESLERFSLGFIVDAAGVSIEVARSAKNVNPLEAESRSKLWAMVERLEDYRCAESLDAKAFAALEAQYCVCTWIE